MLIDKTAPELYGQTESSSYERYLDAKAEQDRRCEQHANLVRECRKQQMNAYLSQKLFTDLKSASNTFEQIPDDPKPSSDEENTPKSHRKRKNDHPLKFDYYISTSTPNQQPFFK